MKKALFYLFLALYLPIIAQESNDEDRVNNLISIAAKKAMSGGSINDINELFSQISEAYPGHSNVYATWGASIMKCAQFNGALYESTFDKFQKATELDHDNVKIYLLWANAIYAYARYKKDNALFPECFSLLQKAVEIDPQSTDTYIEWGMYLIDYGRQIGDAEQYKKSILMLEKALALNSERDEVWEYIGWAYLRIGKAENNLLKYKDQVVGSLGESDRKGGELAAYNLACYYSLIKDKESALKWLEKMLIKRSSEGIKLKEKIDSDKDFDNIRKEKKFKELMKRFF